MLNGIKCTVFRELFSNNTVSWRIPSSSDCPSLPSEGWGWRGAWGGRLSPPGGCFWCGIVDLLYLAWLGGTKSPTLFLSPPESEKGLDRVLCEQCKGDYCVFIHLLFKRYLLNWIVLWFSIFRPASLKLWLFQLLRGVLSVWPDL